MTNKKISALSSASTPLTGSEIVPINQSSVTDSVSVTNLTAGRSVSASDYVMSTGNLVPSTAAKGINFTANTPAAGMTSQLLNWYEQGTWTPNLTNMTVVGSPAVAGTYTRIGRLVYIECRVSSTSIASTAGTSYISGLPFAAVQVSSFIAINASSSVALGSGQVNVTILYTPSFSATAATISCSGSYEV